ncbi:hypothetical protein Hdeb2414_s0119g00802261 [Helianthus debilis subsp. tardiflorus]
MIKIATLISPPMFGFLSWPPYSYSVSPILFRPLSWSSFGSLVYAIPDDASHLESFLHIEQTG